ncbi:unnamed protein product [Sphagnum troendelagicum]|uniref:Uncharacterized protein n=1 Tax=Sphagnum troendelagicum TaxID=128251 RepID=A0ABP0TVJ7_9BRYO
MQVVGSSNKHAMSHAGCSGNLGQQAILGWTRMRPGQLVKRLGSKMIVAACRLGRDQYVPQDQQAPHPNEPGRGGPA